MSHSFCSLSNEIFPRHEFRIVIRWSLDPVIAANKILYFLKKFYVLVPHPVPEKQGGKKKGQRPSHTLSVPRSLAFFFGPSTYRNIA